MAVLGSSCSVPVKTGLLLGCSCELKQQRSLVCLHLLQPSTLLKSDHMVSEPLSAPLVSAGMSLKRLFQSDRYRLKTGLRFLGFFLSRPMMAISVVVFLFCRSQQAMRIVKLFFFF